MNQKHGTKNVITLSKKKTIQFEMKNIISGCIIWNLQMEKYFELECFLFHSKNRFKSQIGIQEKQIRTILTGSFGE